MTVAVNLRRIEDTLAAGITNLTDGKIMLLSDTNKEIMGRVDANRYLFRAGCYTTDGVAFTYIDQDFKDVNVRGNTLAIAQDLQHYGDTDTYLQFTPDALNMTIGGVNILDAVPATIEFNSANADVDFIVNGTTADLFVVDAGANAITVAGTLCGIAAGTIPMGSATTGLAASLLSCTTTEEVTLAVEASKDAYLLISVPTTTKTAIVQCQEDNTHLVKMRHCGSAYPAGNISGVSRVGLDLIQTGSDSTGLLIDQAANAPIVLACNGSEKMRISAAGGVSIGSTTNPGAGNLLVAGTGTFNGLLDVTNVIATTGATSPLLTLNRTSAGNLASGDGVSIDIKCDASLSESVMIGQIRTYLDSNARASIMDFYVEKEESQVKMFSFVGYKNASAFGPYTQTDYPMFINHGLLVGAGVTGTHPGDNNLSVVGTILAGGIATIEANKRVACVNGTTTYNAQATTGAVDLEINGVKYSLQYQGTPA